MALVLFHTDKVRKALEAPATIGVDVLLLVGIAGTIAALAMIVGQDAAPMQKEVVISLSLWALPKYTIYSLGRGFAAYAISLIFTLVYGTIAAHNHTAEKVMLPALDILQSIPVLGFLPGVVLAMIGARQMMKVTTVTGQVPEPIQRIISGVIAIIGTVCSRIVYG